MRDWCSFAEFGADDHLAEGLGGSLCVARCTPDVYQWLRGHGVSFLPVVNWVERGEFRPGNSVPRFHVSWGTGKGLAEALIAALRGHAECGRLTLRFNHRVEHFDAEGGKVDGASGVDENDRHTVRGARRAGGRRGRRHQWRRSRPRAGELASRLGQAAGRLLNGSHRFADGQLHDAIARPAAC